MRHIGLGSKMKRSGGSILREKVLLLLLIGYLSSNVKNMLTISGILWNIYPRTKYKEMMSLLKFWGRIIHLYFMGVWSNTLDIQNLNGNSGRDVNLSFKNYGSANMWKLLLMDSVSWMGIGIIRKLRTIHFCIQINLPQRTICGAIKESWLWLMLDLMEEDLLPYQALIYTIISILLRKNY